MSVWLLLAACYIIKHISCQNIRFCDVTVSCLAFGNNLYFEP